MADALQQLVDDARAAFSAAACSIATLADTDDALIYRVASGEGSERVVGMRLPLTTGLASYVVTSGQALAVKDVAEDPRFARDQAESTGYVPGAMLLAPILIGGEPRGVLSFLDPQAAAGDQIRVPARKSTPKDPIAVTIASASTA